jgi:hypothetical protein
MFLVIREFEPLEMPLIYLFIQRHHVDVSHYRKYLSQSLQTRYVLTIQLDAVPILLLVPRFLVEQWSVFG